MIKPAENLFHARMGITVSRRLKKLINHFFIQYEVFSKPKEIKHFITTFEDTFKGNWRTPWFSTYFVVHMFCTDEQVLNKELDTFVMWAVNNGICLDIPDRQKDGT